jgi:flagellar basal-body rod protein FlgG
VVPPQGQQIGAGVAVDGITGLFTQGGLTPTNQPFDLAISGQGFFSVTLPDGTTGYTRAGNLTANANGQLVTSDGFPLADAITIPANTSSVSVGPDGTVTATLADGTQQVIGNITLTQFQNPAGLSRVGNTTFIATAVSGTPTTGTPGTNGLGIISQGFLEQSNVDLTTELINLIVAQRTFQFNAQAIIAESQTLQTTTTLIQ